jgi:hypothetical protein
MKTIQEASQSANAYDYPTFKGQKHTVFDDGFKTGVKWSEQWISVEDELPEIGEEVLVKSNDSIAVSFRSDDFYSNGKHQFVCERLVEEYNGRSKWLEVEFWRPITHKIR